MMDELSPDRGSRHQKLRYLPNVLTLAAICVGLTAIRFGFEGQFEMAVQLVFVASVLDCLDGRLARMMNTATPVGAELDSLADFLNFGVAPALILYNWAFTDLQGLGWIAVLGYALCCVLRLARFNVGSRTKDETSASDYFVGVPSPAGALLVLLPMVVSFAISDMPLLPQGFMAVYIVLVGVLMISRLPTFSFKSRCIHRGNATFFVLGAGLLGAVLWAYFWISVMCLTLAYVVSMMSAFRTARSTSKT